MMNSVAAYTCPHGPCEGPVRWRITRVGDELVSWACAGHLGQEAERLRRPGELTSLTLMPYGRGTS